MDFYTFITAALQKEWSVWHIRGFMILSLCMQLALTLAAPFRQKTSSRFIVFVVWSSYLLADWAALYVFGLISKPRYNISENSDAEFSPDVMVLWASFLLVHLGGPDTITAFSLEDNALWLRHLVGLVGQLFALLHIFVNTLPNNRFLVPTVLIFVAGVINYGERTRALYLATLESLKKTVTETTTGEGNCDFRTLHRIAKGLVVDIIPDLRECVGSRELILDCSHSTKLKRIKIELNILYEILYTKVKAATSTWGILARGISYYSTQAAFIFFCLADKHGFCGVDLVVTYALFVGVFVLHIANTIMLANTGFRNFDVMESTLLALGLGIFPVPLVLALLFVKVRFLQGSAIVRVLNRQWSEKMGSLNMLSQCFKQCSPLAGERHASREDFDISLWDYVCKDIKEKAEGTFVAARMRELYEARGDRALKESRCRELMRYIRDFEYENTLLIWHVATEICINIEGAEDVDDADRRKFSKKLSNYMMYLLVRKPKLMSAVAGISQIRYENTCAHLKLLGREFRALPMREFCESIIIEGVVRVKPAIEGNNHEHSVLNDSCGLVRLLRAKNNRWEVISKVWLELLSYAAGHCSVDSHLRLLSEGSEFLTLMWMLMAFCGIRDQFPAEMSSKEDENEEIEEPTTEFTEDGKDIQQEIIGLHDVPSGEAIRDQFPVERSSKEDENEEKGESTTEFTEDGKDIQQETFELNDVPTGEAIRDQFPVERSSKEDENEENGESITEFTEDEEDIQ